MLKKVKSLNFIIPILASMLLLGLFLFLIESMDVVSDTNRNNFEYTIRVRNTIEEIDKIVERAEVNLNMLADSIWETYDVGQMQDEDYNIYYSHKIDQVIKSVLMNSPGVDSVWYQPNSTLPFSNKIFCWVTYKDGKIVEYNTAIATLPGTKQLNPVHNPAYKLAVNSKKMVWSDIHINKILNVPMMSIAVPIYNGKKLIGVAGVNISIANFKQALKNMQSKFPQSEIFLLDGQKRIVASQLLPDRKKLTEFSFLEYFRQHPKQNEQMVEYFDGAVRKTAIMIDLSNGYNVVITFPNSVIYMGYERLYQGICLLFVMLVILSIAAWIHARKIKTVSNRLANELLTQKTLINSAPSMLVVKNLFGVILDCNKNFAGAVGKKPEDIIGKTAYDFFDEKIAKAIEENDKKVIETRQTLEEKQVIKFGGKKKILATFNSPLFDHNGELIGLLVNAMDVTEKDEEEEALRKAKELAEHATAMKSSFLANMSHEIRTPMNGVLGFLQLLEDTNPTPEQREFIADAEKSSELLLNIINGILDFSKIEAGKMPLENISFDIRSVVEDIMTMNNSSACKKGIEINSLICSDVPRRVFGDPSRIKQILNNIVGNSVKFTKEGEVVVYVNLLEEAGDNVSISFKIKDTGVGIENDKLDLIFESFSQADTTTTRKFGGTGLGLAISKRLAELMGGQINVESTLGEGSVFTVTIPFKKDHLLPKRIESFVNSLGGKNILVVDENYTDISIIKYYLGEVKSCVLDAHSTEEAIEILNDENCEISAIIIDYKIERAGVLTNFIKANERTKNIPLLLSTSIAIKGDAAYACENGFAGYLTKPIRRTDLIDAIDIAVNRKEKNPTGIFITKHALKEKRFNAKTKILVVEDTELNCKFALKVLNKVGLTCDIANDGSQAVEAFKNQGYDLILMDCQMPIMDGFEATKAIRQMENGNSHTTIIAMTANAMKSDQEKCLEAGMDDFISKPIKTQNLLSMIMKYVKVELEDKESEEGKEQECVNNDTEIDKIISEMIEEVGFSKEEALQLFSEFLGFLSPSIENLETSLNESDFDSVKKLAHKLKGASANLRVEKIAKLSAQLENESPNQNKDLCFDIINKIKDYQNYLAPENSEKDSTASLDS